MKRLIITGDGSHTIYVPELDEHYHSINGAVQESEHIFIRNGFDKCFADPLYLFEVGFGTGLNALLTALRSTNGKREIYYTAIEKYPLDDRIIMSLNYNQLTGKAGKEIFKLIHDSPWNRFKKICRNFSLRKVNGDVVTDHLTGSYNLIYFDAFSPDKQPEIWSEEVFRKIADVTVREGIFTTYSSKGDVKRNLRSCGFEVKLFPGPPGKRHFIRAVKI